LDVTSTEQRKLAGPPSAEAEGQAPQLLAKPSRRVVVHPDQVFQRSLPYREQFSLDPYRARLSLDGVVVRYIMASAAIIAALTSLTALGVALLVR
jgi:hypothetical protein